LIYREETERNIAEQDEGETPAPSESAKTRFTRTFKTNRRNLGIVFGTADFPESYRKGAGDGFRTAEFVLITPKISKIMMELLPTELREELPKLYAQEKTEDPLVYLKFFFPAGHWTWFVTEGEARWRRLSFLRLRHRFGQGMGLFHLEAARRNQHS
jgi:hypothetical protein